MVGTIIAWVIGVHLLELAALGGYLLIKKNRTLEKIVVDQQQYIEVDRKSVV